MTNGDFIRSMTDEDITENFTRGICELIKHRDPERCQNREHCFHCVKDWLKEKNKIMVRASMLQWLVELGSVVQRENYQMDLKKRSKRI